MPPFVASSASRVRQLLGGFSAGQKAVLVVALLAVLVGGFVFVSWAGRPDYAPLYTDLKPGDAAAITEALTAKKTAYRLADGGSTIMVPRDAVYQSRLDMSAQGLPEGGESGYALLDKHGITTSEFQQRVDYQRALEGELAKTIGAIDGVDAAVVHLVIPKDDVFAEDAKKPTASVLVRTKPGSQLSSGQVQAVVHLVSSSVEGLAAEDVTVADAKGRVLSAAGNGGIDMAGGEARTQQQRAYESALSAQAQAMLDKVAGPGKAVVNVSAALDFDKRTTTTERYLVPQRGTPPLTESTSRETYNGNGTPVGGVLGPDNNAVGTAVGGANRYEKASEQRTNSVGKVTEQSQAAPGQVKRLSVAVVLDSAAPGAVDPIEVQRVVSAAVGLDPRRGDAIQVSNLKFDETAAKSAEKELADARKAEQRSQLFALVRTGVVVLLALLLLFLAWRRSKRVQRTPVTIDVERVELERNARAALETANRIEVEQQKRAQLEAAPISDERLAVRQEIGNLIEQQPEEVAQLLRGWLADRRS